MHKPELLIGQLLCPVYPVSDGSWTSDRKFDVFTSKKKRTINIYLLKCEFEQIVQIKKKGMNK